MISKSPIVYRTMFFAFLLLVAASAWAQQWSVLGPDGGDARALTYDSRNPDHIFLGTSTGTVFSSTDGGRSWSRFAHLGNDDNYVLDHIVVDPKGDGSIFVSAWNVENQKTGDLFRSQDGGKTWESLPGMHGKSIRSMTTFAPGSGVLTVGALDGVYRTKDGGDNWERLSPADHAEIKNVESVAVDPKNPNVVYAGTWHLAWKTSDGGITWQHINKGMIEDSDVFSIIVDSSNPAVVFASACSGIYKSDNAGELFHKVQGMPFSARRTRVLKQDPANPSVVYAGTTEGLWKTTDAGKTWKRMTSAEVVVNDVLIDPRDSKRVLLATDRGGVMASDNGAQTFASSNHGYTHRYVTAMLVDKSDPDTLFVGVANDREWGGVFSVRMSGLHWQQKSTGLGGRDIFTLKQAADGALVAGTNRGIFILNRGGAAWKPINTIINEDPAQRSSRSKTKKVVAPKPGGPSLVEAKINEIEITPQQWLAATSMGLFASSNQGKSWSGGPVLAMKDFISVRSVGQLKVLATHTDLLVSRDGGTVWQQLTMPAHLTSIRGVTLTPDEQILVASREGAFRSADIGQTWKHLMNGLPDRDISSIVYDEEGQRLLATSMAVSTIFQSSDGGSGWQAGPDSGYPLRRVSVVKGRFIAVTPFDGIIVQP
jgi:photosystem II stability/assembly factor-like uncharacterized protein